MIWTIACIPDNTEWKDIMYFLIRRESESYARNTDLLLHSDQIFTRMVHDVELELAM